MDTYWGWLSGLGRVGVEGGGNVPREKFFNAIDRMFSSLSARYSCRSDSIGSSRDARSAGIIPLISPTAPRITVDAIRVAG